MRVNGTGTKLLRMRQVQQIFRRNRGAAAEFARNMDISEVTVSYVLRGYLKSPRLVTAAKERAAELLASEKTS
jgi:hypothetical protein